MNCAIAQFGKQPGWRVRCLRSTTPAPSRAAAQSFAARPPLWSALARWRRSLAVTRTRGARPSTRVSPATFVDALPALAAPGPIAACAAGIVMSHNPHATVAPTATPVPQRCDRLLSPLVYPVPLSFQGALLRDAPSVPVAGRIFLTGGALAFHRPRPSSPPPARNRTHAPARTRDTDRPEPTVGPTFLSARWQASRCLVPRRMPAPPSLSQSH